YVEIPSAEDKYFQRNEVADVKEKWLADLADLNGCSQKGLVAMFDSSIGAGSVLMPHGGVYQMTPSQAMAAKIPVLGGETNTCSLMGWGYNPDISSKSPYHGAMLAVIESVAKVVAAGGTYKKCWLTFQEYFERTQNDPKRWGKPMAALLGAFRAQLELGCGAIGGKDSMSGTFENIDVPPTLVSFAVSTAKADKVVSTEFKKAGDKVIYIAPDYDENGLPVFDSIKAVFDKIEDIIAAGRAAAIWTIGYGGAAEGIAKMCLGNKLGFEFTSRLTPKQLYTPCYGAFIIELTGEASDDELVIGKTTDTYRIDTLEYSLGLDNLQRVWEGKLEPVFPCRIKTTDATPAKYSYKNTATLASSEKFAKPRVVIPVFPGTNCEYDTARAFERAGAAAEVIVIRNQAAGDIEASVEQFEKAIRESQMIMIPGGFSGGDEPEGSGKFITAFFRNPMIKDAVHDLLKNRDGLMLGICNGFQALVKLGLVPFGEIVDMKDDSPTLTFNTINRHQSMMVNTRIVSHKSPWLYGTEVGDVHTIPISHGEGRFVAPESLIQKMADNGQIATQYVDLAGDPTMDIRYNPNTSVDAIEGITSPDGRVFGKMGHSERIGSFICKNVAGEKDQRIFESGVAYFK
ncbi:MAG: phosphoribosylformylglycinamidine synthase subunit PurQ, partial [Ruminococcus sp.]|nr:phosphoribosylformylglycinamidine synthase subunit PurQ [Ruminococcus sp.]